ncbi:uncharacterized protein [Emydura macquarii macquarii]|uniref:uncharacterized protein n=1 Tax=Emydura macquarii macquarii TaxID=1129001 RepID=UPI00352AE995
MYQSVGWHCQAPARGWYGASTRYTRILPDLRGLCRAAWTPREWGAYWGVSQAPPSLTPPCLYCPGGNLRVTAVALLNVVCAPACGFVSAGEPPPMGSCGSFLAGAEAGHPRQRLGLRPGMWPPGHQIVWTLLSGAAKKAAQPGMEPSGSWSLCHKQDSGWRVPSEAGSARSVAQPGSFPRGPHCFGLPVGRGGRAGLLGAGRGSEPGTHLLSASSEWLCWEVGAWLQRLCASGASVFRADSSSCPAGSLPAQPCPALMDLWRVPASREKGWYLALMAPNVKGPKYAWLDPSRLYCHWQGLRDCAADLLQPFCADAIDLVAGIDAMGFILGAAMASTLRKGFLAIRKAGHLCVETCTQRYTDYSTHQKLMEMRTDAIQPGRRVLLVDQWIETGGTMRAAIQLVEQQGGVIAGVAAICIEDSEGGRWIQERYKCSQCVPRHLMPQFNSHQLQSFQAFGATPDQPSGLPCPAPEPHAKAPLHGP